jgi:hypothetical protein
MNDGWSQRLGTRSRLVFTDDFREEVPQVSNIGLATTNGQKLSDSEDIPPCQKAPIGKGQRRYAVCAEGLRS